MGSRDNSDGLSSVSVIGLPSSHVAKSAENDSARNLQTLSNIACNYISNVVPLEIRNELGNISLLTNGP